MEEVSASLNILSHDVINFEHCTTNTDQKSENILTYYEQVLLFFSFCDFISRMSILFLV